MRPVPAPLSPQSSKRRPGETRVAGGECDSWPVQRPDFLFLGGVGDAILEWWAFGVVGFWSGERYWIFGGMRFSSFERVVKWSASQIWMPRGVNWMQWEEYSQTSSERAFFGPTLDDSKESQEDTSHFRGSPNLRQPQMFIGGNP